MLWHDDRMQEVQVCSDTALWYRSGQPPLPIRWVLVRRHDQPPRAFFSTCPDDRATDIVSAYLKRWSIETTPDQVRGRLFEESRAHLGFETQRQWSDLATERTTRCLLGLYSMVALLAHGPVPGGWPIGAPARLVCQAAGDVQRCPGSGALPSVGG